MNPPRKAQPPSFSTQEFRTALGMFATGVTIVTARTADGQVIGLTANSFNSVSLDPPLLLVCIHKEATCAQALTAADHFAINVLQTEQQPASIRFSTRQEDRFGVNDWSRGEFGAPVLKESLSVFECERYAVYDGGEATARLARNRRVGDLALVRRFGRRADAPRRRCGRWSSWW